MKLVFCTDCHDVVKMEMIQWRWCRCGQSAGRYTDELNAEIYGKRAIPLGFNNTSLVCAVRAAQSGIIEHPEFTSWVITKCDSVTKIKKKPR